MKNITDELRKRGVHVVVKVIPEDRFSLIDLSLPDESLPFAIFTKDYTLLRELDKEHIQ